MTIFAVADIIPCTPHIFSPKNLKKYTLKNLSIYPFPKFNCHLEISAEGNPKAPFLKWLVQYGILTRINC